MWDPWKDVDGFLKHISSIHNGIANNGYYFSSTAKGSWIPQMDIVESEKSYTLTADLPGVKKEDVEVVLDNNRVCISGARAVPQHLSDTSSQKHYAMVERGYGRFERCIQLPHRVVEGSVKAQFLEGVLDVSMDKQDSASTSNRGSRVNIS